MKEKEESRLFEIVVGVRDSKGNLTNKRRSYATDSADRLASWWYNNTAIKEKKKKAESLPTAEQAEQILSTINQPE